MEDELVKCACGKLININEMERIHDNHGIYIGCRCGWNCPDLAHWNLDYSNLDAIENGEQIEADY